MADIFKGGFLAGYKTYIVAGLIVLGALGSYLVGDMSLIDAGKAILEGLGLGTLRAGVAKAIS